MSEETKHLILVLAGFVVPALLSPLVVMALRPLFAIFLREGLELFTEVKLESALIRGIGGVMAKANVIILLFAWWGAFAWHVIDGTWVLPAVLAIVGVMIALIVTVQMVRNRVGVVGQPSMLVGLLTFAGGNLPIFLLVPIVLLVR